MKPGSLVVRMKKGKDGRTALSCLRADGTTTWQRHEGAQAAFFPRHDLTHFTVETTLGLREGFFGLVASGWDLSDFGAPWPRGPLPAEGNLTEIIVGFLDLERSSEQCMSTDEMNQRIAAYTDSNGLSTLLVVSEAQITRIRQRRAELFARWDATEAGDTLELSFEA